MKNEKPYGIKPRTDGYYRVRGPTCLEGFVANWLLLADAQKVAAALNAAYAAGFLAGKKKVKK